MTSLLKNGLTGRASWFGLILPAIMIILTAAAPAGAQEGASEPIITVSAVGDVMMGAPGRMPPDEGKTLFSAGREYLAGRDLVFLNHEGVLADVGKPTKPSIPGRSYVFRTPPEYAVFLSQAGFNMASLANNHSFDYNQAGLQMTQKVLADQNIATSHHSGTIARLEVKGVKTAMAAFWIWSGGAHDLNNIPAAKKVVEKLTREADIVIVSFHGGAEGLGCIRTPKRMEKYMGENRGDLVKFAHAVVDAGADLVIGHGPHVPRAMEVYQGRLIAYSLGNFCTMGFGTSSYLGYAPLLQCELRPDGSLIGGRVVSFIQTRGRPPVLDRQGRAAKLIHELGLQDFPETNAVAADGSLIAGGER